MNSTNLALDERRPVTILFTDIVGSTTLAEQLDPEEWKEVVNGAHERVSHAVTLYEGTIAQFLGDGVLAFFGAPHAHEDDPARAVNAGLQIQRAIADYAHTLQGYVDNFQMRVGINTGTVVVGGLGSADHLEYLAVGDAVNLAARLQSAAPPGTVLLSETTARLVSHLFEVLDLGEITVKGKAVPLRVFKVEERKARAVSGHGLQGWSSPLVGRERELEQLRAALEEVDAGHGEIVFVLGEAGIGKSRLVEEARRGRHPGSIRFLEGRGISYGQALPFWTITQLIQNDLGLADGDPEIRIKVALRRRCNELFGSRSEDYFPYLAQLLGVKLEVDAAERVRAIDGETLKHQTLVSICEYFQHIAEQQPTVLLLEDLHWADPSTLESLGPLFALTNRVPLMLLMLMRVEHDHGSWRAMQAARTDYEHRYTEISLKPLTADEQNHVLSNLLGLDAVPEPTRRLILERTEGNPLYVEEIIRHLIEQGALSRNSEGRWQLDVPLSTLEIPDTLHGILLARIDCLQDDVRQTLQLASVIGKTFLYRLLQAIAEAERELDVHLAQLQRVDLVREKARRPELEYMFKHSLTQQAAYDSLLMERRREFHRKVGMALEELFADRRDEFLGLLAYHFDRAGDRSKAIDYLLRAGDKTRLQDAHEEAIQFYERARTLLLESGDLERAVKTWLKLGLIYHANFEFEKAHEANENAFALEAQAQRESAGQVSEAETGINIPQRVLRLDMVIGKTLDPGIGSLGMQGRVIENIFAGLVEMDAELNLLPHGARSWEVLDGGRRYVFHLRDDVRWSSGAAVVAADYEWAWKRNLRLNKPWVAVLLDDVIGAVGYRRGEMSDAGSVGVRALDPATLEVRLNEPRPYFPYIMAMSVALPLPRETIETYSDEWWKPEHIVTNGAFRLVEYDPEGTRLTLERNPSYFGEFPGNLDRVKLVYADPTATRDQLTEIRGKQYLADELDLSLGVLKDPISKQQMITDVSEGLFTNYLILNLSRPPLDDVRVRRALFHAVDRQRLNDVYSNWSPGLRVATGGLIPLGMAGHSPGIGLKHDLETARELLAQAGYPGGKGIPVLQLRHAEGSNSDVSKLLNELARQWKEGLGIESHFEDQVPESLVDVLLGGWIADYPDPDTFMRVWALSGPYPEMLRLEPKYVELVEEAARKTDRARRMALYRQADYYLVVEQALVYPRAYGRNVQAAKPWVKHHQVSPTGWLHFKNIVLEPH